jgi:hypothetical protein
MVMAADLVAVGHAAPVVRATRGPRIAGVMALLIALVSAGAHLSALGHLRPFADVVSVTMAIACVACGVHLVRTPSARASATTAVMAAAMMAIHLTAMGGSGPAGAHQHRHGMAMPVPGAMSDDMGTMAGSQMTVLMATTAAELVFALGALWFVTRSRVQP